MTIYDIIAIITILVPVQIIAMFVNGGALFAYFQRNRLDSCKEFYKDHLMNAILWALPGILTFPGVFIATEKFRFGWKFTKRENPNSSWWEEVEKQYRRKEFLKERSSARRVEIPEGYCIDMWED